MSGSVVNGHGWKIATIVLGALLGVAVALGTWNFRYTLQNREANVEIRIRLDQVEKNIDEIKRRANP